MVQPASEVWASSGAERVSACPHLMNRERKVQAMHNIFEHLCADSADISGALELA